MLKDRPELALTVGSAISRKSYDDAVLLASQHSDQLAKRAASLCHGRRQFARPIMALMTKKNLGPVRHALSQMVVAGTMVVNPPVQVRITSPREEAGDSGE